MQTTSHLLMIRPVNFGFNTETAVNNAFQVPGADENAQQKASEEFNGFVQKLREAGVDVTVVDDTPDPYTPDSIFPNNWISFHQDGTICLYPMYAPNRRLERKEQVLNTIAAAFKINRTLDFSHYESSHLFLEGTGSMVLDRDYNVAYACLSPRTDKKVLDDFCWQMNFREVSFLAEDRNHQAIYHTNVMMCVADRYVVICLECLPVPEQRKQVVDTILSTGKEIIDISLDQMNHFAGNMLQVENAGKEKLLVMSSQAFESLTKEQLVKLESFNPIVHADLQTIETNGGGSARCMMAEIHLPKK